MDAFREIKDPQLDLPTIVRIQQNVSTWTKQFDAPVSVAVQDVLSSSSTSSYSVKPDDAYLVVNARGGPIKIVLPTPNRATQVVRVLNAYVTANSVSIVQADAGKFNDGSGSIGLPALESAEMVCNGRIWSRFGVP